MGLIFWGHAAEGQAMAKVDEVPSQAPMDLPDCPRVERVLFILA